MKRVHFIAIGGSAMHNLAIALHQKGYTVTGSDDEIFDPARSRLASYGLLPSEEGWHPEKISSELDAVVLGMHARKDNPELLRAQELGLKIYSYPEFLYEQSRNKTRVVIGGSHGKTTITAMILHVLRQVGMDTDYMVGAQLKGFDVMVRLSEQARVMVIEGDEYLTSPIDPRPKFHLYKPNVAVISGIAWDHVNVFPTFDVYKEQFTRFVDLVEANGTLVYCAADPQVCEVVDGCQRTDITRSPYNVPNYRVVDGQTLLMLPCGEVSLQVFGRHNMLNIMAAYYVCRQLGVSDEAFGTAIASFEGAGKRLELVKATSTCAVYKDFAHAPSKLKATVAAVKEQYADRRLVACMELHTFSSLSANFLKHYEGSMAGADVALVYFSPHAIQLKRLPALNKELVASAFGGGVEVYDDSSALVERVKALFPRGTSHSNLLMMSSGNFDGVDMAQLAVELIGEA